MQLNSGAMLQNKKNSYFPGDYLFLFIFIFIYGKFRQFLKSSEKGSQLVLGILISQTWNATHLLAKCFHPSVYMTLPSS